MLSETSIKGIAGLTAPNDTGGIGESASLKSALVIHTPAAPAPTPAAPTATDATRLHGRRPILIRTDT